MSDKTSSSKRNSKEYQKALILICFVIILCALSVFLIVFRRNQDKNSYVAYIYSDGELQTTIDLSQITETQDITFSDGAGGYNIIRVSYGKIEVIEANCPDKVCVHMGAIHSSAIPIVCLPHKLVIVLKENGTKAPDTITY